MKETNFYLVQNGPKKAPSYFTEGEMRTNYGNDVDAACIGLSGDGKTVKKVVFAAGDTVTANVSDLNVQGVMAELDAAFRPVGEDESINAICSIYSTTAKNQSMAAVLGGDEDFREWLGDRQSNKLQSIETTFTSKVYERTWMIQRQAFDDDQSGIMRERIQSFAAESNAAVLRMVVDMYTAGETATSFIDGQTFFDTDHSYSTLGGYATSQSNKSTTALSTAEIELDVAKMGALLGFNGNGKANKGPTAVLANPINKPLVMESFLAPVFYSAAATAGGARGSGMNWLKGQIPPQNLVFHGSVTSGDLFLIEKRPVAPVIMMQRSDVPDEFVVQMDPRTSDTVFNRDYYAIGERRAFRLGYGHWDCAFGIFP